MTSNGFEWGCAQAILSSSISGVELDCQSVLIALAADLHTNKPWQGQHKFWKYVSPIRTYLAWLPEQLARTNCRAALDRTGAPVSPMEACTTCRDGSPISGIPLCSKTSITLGTQELEVFLRISLERLRLCCGIQCTDSLHPNGPRQRRKLFTASQA